MFRQPCPLVRERRRCPGNQEHMKRRILLMSVFFTFLFLLTTAACAFAAESDPAAANAQRYGFWTLLPPLLAIVLAFITKEPSPLYF